MQGEITTGADSSRLKGGKQGGGCRGVSVGTCQNKNAAEESTELDLMDARDEPQPAVVTEDEIAVLSGLLHIPLHTPPLSSAAISLSILQGSCGFKQPRTCTDRTLFPKGRVGTIKESDIKMYRFTSYLIWKPHTSIGCRSNNPSGRPALHM